MRKKSFCVISIPHWRIHTLSIWHLVDEDTGLIEEDIPTVLAYLFKNYGRVPSEEAKQKEAEVLSITFQPADHMVILFWPIE